MSLLPDPTAFLDDLFARLTNGDGRLDHLTLDHLCYRVATPGRYAELRDGLLTEAHELLVESPVNGRSIATFRMATPFRHGGREIWLLELPEPKTGSPYPEGYEHVEFVTDRPLAAFEHWLTETLEVAPDAIDRSGVTKPLNADLRLRLAGGLSVKFHELALDEVIRLERISHDG